MYHIIKQILSNDTDEDFKIVKKEDYKVICFDSESGDSRIIDWSLKNVFDDISDDYIKNELQEKLFLYSLAKVSPFNRGNEIDKIYNQLQEKYPNSHFIVGIDIVSCLTDDPNANSNFGIIDKLKSKLTSLSISNPALAAHYQYAISRINDPEKITLPKPVVIPPGAPIGCDLD